MSSPHSPSPQSSNSSHPRPLKLDDSDPYRSQNQDNSKQSEIASGDLNIQNKEKAVIHGEELTGIDNKVRAADYSASAKELKEELFQCFQEMNSSLQDMISNIKDEKLQMEAKEMGIIFSERYNTIMNSLSEQNLNTHAKFNALNHILVYYSRIFRHLLHIYKKDCQIQHPSSENVHGVMTVDARWMDQYNDALKSQERILKKYYYQDFEHVHEGDLKESSEKKRHSTGSIESHSLYESDEEDEDRHPQKPLLHRKEVQKIPLYKRIYFFLGIFLPWLLWIPEYFKGGAKQIIVNNILGDVFAGITVGVLLIPQGMAYSMIAGLPPVYGLYSSLIPLVIYPFLGTSRVLSVGPVAISSLLTNAAVTGLMITTPEAGEVHMQERIMLTFLLSIFVGGIRLISGILRLGFIVNFLSHPVISGYTSAAALFIMATQLRHILGIYSAPSESSTIYMLLYELIIRLGEAYWPTIIFGVLGIAILLFFSYFNVKIKGRTINFKRIPIPIVFILIATLIMFIIQASTQYVSETGNEIFGIRIIGTIPQGLPSPLLPVLPAGRTFDWNLFVQLLFAALPIALIGFLESISISKFYGAKMNHNVDASQELIALGVSGSVSGFFQCIPVSGGFSRTAVNAGQGAKSQFSALLSALVILITLLLLTPALFFLPMVALAAVIIVACIKLIDVQILIFTWKTKKRDFFLAIIAFLATLFVGTVEGIIISAALAIIFVLFRSSRPRYVKEGRIPGTMEYRNVRFWTNAIETPGIVVARFDSDLFFANISFFSDKTLEFIRKSEYPVYYFILDCKSINQIDSSSIESLVSLDKLLQEKKKDQVPAVLYFASCKVAIQKVLERSGLMKKFGKDRFFDTIHQAVQDAERGMNEKLKEEEQKRPKPLEQEMKEQDHQTHTVVDIPPVVDVNKNEKKNEFHDVELDENEGRT